MKKELRQYIRSWVLIMLIGCGIFDLHAQSENLIFRNITPDDGLPVTSMNGITQDAFGYIWFGTWYGVYRYDGNTFEKKSDSGRFVTADDMGDMWISYDRVFNGIGTIAHYDAQSDSLTLYYIPGRENSYIRTTIDASGTLWADSDNGLYSFNESTRSFEKDSIARPDIGHQELVAHKDSTLSFVYNEPGVKCGIGNRGVNNTIQYEDFPLDQNNPDPTLPFNASSRPLMIGFGDNGLLLINSFGWAYKENFSSNWTFVKPDRVDILPNRLNGQSAITYRSNVYVRHENALTKFDIGSGKSSTYHHNPLNPKSILPADDEYTHLFIDRQDVLWIPSFAYGFSRLNLYESDFGLLRLEDGTPVRDVISAVELEDGSFLVGSRVSENGLLHYDANGNIIQSYTGPFDSPPGRSVTDEISHPFVWGLISGSDGSIWAGTGSPGPDDGGLNRIRPGSNEITRFKHDPNDEASVYPGNWVSNLIEDGSGRIWFRGFNQIAWIDPETEIITRFQHPKNIDLIDMSNHMMKTNDGDLIISSQNNVYYRIHHKDLSTEILDLNIEWERYTGIYLQDNNSRFWVGNSTGFGILDSMLTTIETWYNINTYNFPVNELSAIQIDDDNTIWLQSDNGIVRFDPSTEEVTHYSYERGLQGYTFSGRVNYKGPSGKLYFGDNGGINIFDPAQIQVNPHPPEMVITKVNLDGKDISLDLNQTLITHKNSDKGVTVQPDVSSIGFEFAALHFAGDNSNRYQFKLDGFNADWRDGGTIGLATYTNLSPGKYTFRIKGSNLDGVWSDGNTALLLNVLPPWYQTWWAYGIYVLLMTTGIIGFARIQRKRVQQKERELAREKELAQAKEIEKAYQNLETAHENLKSAQDQLIQQEKLASLGQLTAGIAHEIKNPLNFVNNFSDVSSEMIEELIAAMKKGELDEADELANEIAQNLKKIHQHGSRADSIVKSMLEHSSGGKGKMEPTDLNALVKDFTNLAYHSMRAGKNPIDVDIELKLDESVRQVPLIAEDFTRVILNLCSNSFDAMRQKGEENRDKVEEFFAKLIVRTWRDGDSITIDIEDNGVGIPDDIKDKILQPFFTTKKGTEGTGLGLSLSYDIIKAHGGTLIVNSKPGNTTFTITLNT